MPLARSRPKGAFWIELTVGVHRTTCVLRVHCVLHASFDQVTSTPRAHSKTTSHACENRGTECLFDYAPRMPKLQQCIRVPEVWLWQSNEICEVDIALYVHSCPRPILQVFENNTRGHLWTLVSPCGKPFNPSVSISSAHDRPTTESNSFLSCLLPPTACVHECQQSASPTTNIRNRVY